MPVANYSVLTKHVSANAVLYPSLQPHYQRSRSNLPALVNFHKKLSGQTQPLDPKLLLMKQQVFLLVLFIIYEKKG